MQMESKPSAPRTCSPIVLDVSPICPFGSLLVEDALCGVLCYGPRLDSSHSLALLSLASTCQGLGLPATTDVGHTGSCCWQVSVPRGGRYTRPSRAASLQSSYSADSR